MWCYFFSVGAHNELLSNPEGAYSQLIRLQQIHKDQQPDKDDSHIATAENDDQVSESKYLDAQMDSLNASVAISRSGSARTSSGRKSASARHSMSGFRARISFTLNDNKSSKSSYKSTGSSQVDPSEDLESTTAAAHIAQGKNSVNEKVTAATTLNIIPAAAETSLFRLAALNKPELPYFLIGTLAAAASGLAFPIFGLLLSNVINAFFIPNPHQLRREANKWALAYVLMAVGIFIVAPIQFFSFGVIGNKLIRRIRCMVFEHIVRQEVSWFDKDDSSR
jgi:ATP-binding cassette subfamily B (MDR/TAP) protein 1